MYTFFFQVSGDVVNLCCILSAQLCMCVTPNGCLCSEYRNFGSLPSGQLYTDWCCDTLARVRRPEVVLKLSTLRKHNLFVFTTAARFIQMKRQNAYLE